MSRTYRDIPDHGRAARDKESAKHSPDGWRSRVPDAANHGCTYSKPAWFTRDLNRSMRSRTSQMLQDAVNHNWTAEDFEELVLPCPKEYLDYYW